MITQLNSSVNISFFGSRTGPRISGGRVRELARVDACPLQPLDGRREAPNNQWMAIRGADGTARSVRAIDELRRGKRASVIPSILKRLVQVSRYAAD